MKSHTVWLNLDVFLLFLATLDFQAVPRHSGRTFKKKFVVGKKLPYNVLEKVKIFRVGQWGDFTRYNDFRVKSPPHSLFRV